MLPDQSKESIKGLPVPCSIVSVWRCISTGVSPRKYTEKVCIYLKSIEYFIPDVKNYEALSDAHAHTGSYRES